RDQVGSAHRDARCARVGGDPVFQLQPCVEQGGQRPEYSTRGFGDPPHQYQLSPKIAAEYIEIKSSASFDTEAIIACPNLIAAVHLRVLRRQRIEKRSIPAAEVADADDAVGVGDHFEMFARQEFVRHAHVTFASDDQTARRDLELLY